MVHVLPAADRPPSTSRTIRFEGDAYGTPVSFFAVNVAPGQGPVLHRHPYPETWIVLRGQAEVVAGERVFRVGPGDVAVVPAEMPHKFTAIGDERLEMTCIHAAGTMVQENLE